LWEVEQKQKNARGKWGKKALRCRRGGVGLPSWGGAIKKRYRRKKGGKCKKVGMGGKEKKGTHDFV